MDSARDIQANIEKMNNARERVVSRLRRLEAKMGQYRELSGESNPEPGYEEYMQDKVLYNPLKKAQRNYLRAQINDLAAKNDFMIDQVAMLQNELSEVKRIESQASDVPELSPLADSAPGSEASPAERNLGPSI